MKHYVVRTDDVFRLDRRSARKIHDGTLHTVILTSQRWQGYGFLPGYKQPPNNSLPLYADKEAMRNGPRGNRRHWYIDGTPKYLLYNGEWHYFGQPGFYRGHYNGGSFGPCWTRTPVGMVWTCG